MRFFYEDSFRVSGPHPLCRADAMDAHPGPKWHWPPTNNKRSNAEGHLVGFYVGNGPIPGIGIEFANARFRGCSCHSVGPTGSRHRPNAVVRRATSSDRSTAKQDFGRYGHVYKIMKNTSAHPRQVGLHAAQNNRRHSLHRKPFSFRLP